MYLDGSLGYIGAVREPFRIEIQNGKIVFIEETEDGKRLKEYLESFEDERMYTAGELAYGTYHIGFGRNLALGGAYEASGHFDLVMLEPDIYTDNRKIMERGRVIVPEPQLY